MHTDLCGAYIYDAEGNTLAIAPDAKRRADGWRVGKKQPRDTTALLRATDFAAACFRYGWKVVKA